VKGRLVIDFRGIRCTDPGFWYAWKMIGSSTPFFTCIIFSENPFDK